MKYSIPSIKDKLKNYSKREQKVHQFTLIRYFQERFLYRLSISKYRSNFLLKGGALVYSLNREMSRPTLDIDLLAKKINTTDKHILQIFSDIVQIDYPDGVDFFVNEMEITAIQKEGSYQGTRVKIPAKLGNIKHTLQIDIGLGDAVFPAPTEISYPTLIDLEAPNLLAYSTESMIAEKFQEMIVLGEYNSRMKDFYDVYTFLKTENAYNQANLKQAIQATFLRRETFPVENHVLFSGDFCQNKKRQIQWKAFLKKSKLDESIEFCEVMDLVKDKLQLIYEVL